MERTVIEVRRTAIGTPYTRRAKYINNELVEVKWTRMSEQEYAASAARQEQIASIISKMNALGGPL